VPTTFNTKSFSAITNGDLTTTLNSDPIFFQQMIYVTAQISSTGSPNGTLEVYGSNDFGAQPGYGSPTITNWALVGTKTVTATGEAVAATAVGYRWLKVKWTDTSSSGTGTFNVTIKGDRDFEPMPKGLIVSDGSSITPGGFLYCDGCAVSRSTYVSLFNAIGTNYGIGDGSTTFNIPDLRGVFVRGQADGEATDPDRATRTPVSGGNSGDNVGSYQVEDYLSHVHGGILAKTGEIHEQAGGWLTYDLPGYNTAAAGGNETRPNNLNVRYYIKY
jgi:hypothetical protein